MSSTHFPHLTLATPLHLLDYRESSQIVTLLTREYGKISVLARGIKPLKRKATLQPMELLSFYEVRLRPGKELHYLAENQLVGFFPSFRRDLARLYAGYYVLELVKAILQEGDPSEEIFDLFMESSEKLSDTTQIKPVLIEFEYRLLAQTGFFPNLQQCFLCGDAFQEWLFFNAKEGSARCFSCHRNTKKLRNTSTFLKLSKKTADAFLQVEHSSFSAEEQTILEIRKFLQHYWRYLLEQELNLFPYISKMKTP